MKSKIKAILVAAMLATATLSAQSAYAADPTFLIEDDGAGGFSGTIGHIFTAPTASFTDQFLFDITTGFNTSTSITSTFTQIGQGGNVKTKDVLITGFNLIQYVGNTNNIVKIYNGVNNTPAGVHPTDAWEISANSLSAGTYYLQVTGAVTGNVGGSYAGDISVLAVPEPETYGMMLGGLALVGLVARRKAAKKAAQA